MRGNLERQTEFCLVGTVEIGVAKTWSLQQKRHATMQISLSRAEELASASLASGDQMPRFGRVGSDCRGV